MPYIVHQGHQLDWHAHFPTAFTSARINTARGAICSRHLSMQRNTKSTGANQPAAEASARRFEVQRRLGGSAGGSAGPREVPLTTLIRRSSGAAEELRWDYQTSFPPNTPQQVNSLLHLVIHSLILQLIKRFCDTGASFHGKPISNWFSMGTFFVASQCACSTQPLDWQINGIISCIHLGSQKTCHLTQNFTTSAACPAPSPRYPAPFRVFTWSNYTDR